MSVAVAPTREFPHTPETWRTSTRILFRFAIIYIPLQSLNALVSPFAWMDKLQDAQRTQLAHILPWVGVHVFRIGPQTNLAAMRPDGPAWWLYAVCCLLLAALASGVWSVLDGHRTSYPALHEWATLCIRLALAMSLAGYGASKLIPTQFGPLDNTPSAFLFRMGDVTPHVMLWTFMRSSAVYTVFTGAVEMIAALLLFVPRSTTAGALLAFASLTNVLVLNLGYDTNQRLHIIAFLSMAVFLLCPDWERLVGALIFGRSTEPRLRRPLFASTSLNTSAAWMQGIFALVVVALSLTHSYRDYREAAAGRTSPLFGVWRVEEFQVNGQDRPPLLTDALRWQRLIVDGGGSVEAELMDGSLLYFSGSAKDTTSATVDIRSLRFAVCCNVSPTTGHYKSEYRIEVHAPAELTATGNIDGQPVVVKCVREAQHYLLTDTPVRWINTPVVR